MWFQIGWLDHFRSRGQPAVCEYISTLAHVFLDEYSFCQQHQQPMEDGDSRGHMQQDRGSNKPPGDCSRKVEQAGFVDLMLV